MADFSFYLSDTDESAVDDLISQAQDLCVLEQVSAINCSGFTDSLLPTELESRFRKLKSFPESSASRPPLLTTGSARRNSVEGKTDPVSDAAIFSPSKQNPDEKLGSNLKSDPSEFSVAKSKYNPGGKRGSKAKLKSGSVSSPSNSSNSSPESAIFSPSKQNPDKKQRSTPKPKSRSFDSPPDSSNSLTDSPSPPRKSCCLWCSPKTKRASHTKSKEKGAIDFGAGLNFSDDDGLLSDLGSFSKKEQARKLKKAMKEEEKICREAEKIVKWAKQASARMSAAAIEDELVSQISHCTQGNDFSFLGRCLVGSPASAGKLVRGGWLVLRRRQRKLAAGVCFVFFRFGLLLLWGSMPLLRASIVNEVNEPPSLCIIWIPYIHDLNVKESDYLSLDLLVSYLSNDCERCSTRRQPTLANSHGFTADLIHRDSPLSPWYNSSVSHYDRLHDAFCRSVTRANRFVKPIITSSSSLSSSADIQSRIISSNGEYLMNVSIGTPPVEVLGIADTGSDLIWTQCKPCKQCFNQKPPLFDPKKSSTYRSIPCQSNSCTYLEEAACGTQDYEHETCDYSYRYGDRSFTRGTLAVETFTIGSTTGRPVSLPKILFGCGHQNGGTFDESGSGLIGLGGGPLSLASQLTKSTGGGKFSYCLVPLASNSENPNNNLASKISFGSAGIVSGAGAVSTPLVAKEPDTFYYLTLEAISVGEKRLAYKTKSPNCEDSPAVAVAGNEGNIIIDSGTTLTFLPPGFYDDLVSALEVAINAERVSDPRGILSLCFRSEGDDIGVPVITAHFKGADVKMQAVNTFARMEEDLVCLTMIPSSDVAIFGNLAQINFLVGYDLEDRTVSFKPADCTKH
ncbi:hypothetical protein ACFX13_023406 [Malus domestica]